MTKWLKQFDHVEPRYRYLVLTGPSKMGKTAFARCLAKAGMDTLELNCAAGSEPDLRAYRLGLHDCIVFGEIKATQIIAHNKLFQ